MAHPPALPLSMLVAATGSAMLAAVTAIFVCQLAGEMITAGLGLPLPGPVIGMALLFVFLAVKGSVPSEIAKVGDALLQHLSLLFVPAGAGIMMHFSRLRENALSVGAALILSTLATILVTALVMRAMTKGKNHAD